MTLSGAIAHEALRSVLLVVGLYLADDLVDNVLAKVVDGYVGRRVHQLRRLRTKVNRVMEVRH